MKRSCRKDILLVKFFQCYLPIPKHNTTYSCGEENVFLKLFFYLSLAQNFCWKCTILKILMDRDTSILHCTEVCVCFYQSVDSVHRWHAYIPLPLTKLKQICSSCHFSTTLKKLIKQHICWENIEENVHAAAKTQTIQVQDDFSLQQDHMDEHAKNILI